MIVKSTGRARSVLSLLSLGTMLLLAACAGGDRYPATGDDGGPVPPEFRDLKGWGHDNFAEAVPALLRSCLYLRSLGPGHAVGTNAKAGLVSDWLPACAEAKRLPPENGLAARHYFEKWFLPVALKSGDTSASGQEGLFTGYYEPELNGSWTRTERFSTPLYRMPPRGRHALPPRARIAAGALARHGLELLWVDDPIEAFIMEIQGSGRVRMSDGSVVGINYAGQNGQKYYPIGRHLIDLGVGTPQTMTMHMIRDWLRQHPDQAQSVMNLNPSYIFFKTRPSGEPRGASAELTPRRSLAVDPYYVPLGVPIWLDVHDVPVIDGGILRRLVLAQDTGGAIKGAVRGDFFWGHGEEAAFAAGVMKARGRYFMLVPRPVAERMPGAARRP